MDGTWVWLSQLQQPATNGVHCSDDCAITVQQIRGMEYGDCSMTIAYQIQRGIVYEQGIKCRYKDIEYGDCSMGIQY